MSAWDAIREFAAEVQRAKEAHERRRAPYAGPPPDEARPGGVSGDATASTLPISLLGLVRSFRVDLEAEVRRLIAAGAPQVRIGIGEGVDVQLLTDDLLAAHVRLVERAVLVATVRWTDRGWAVARSFSNFGVFWHLSGARHEWSAVRRDSHIEGLHPGDVVGLGSCPADAVTFTLPAPPPGAKPVAGPASRDWRAEERLRVAIQHWQYADVTIGAGPKAVVRLDSPDLADVALMLSRDLDDPGAGFRLRVLGVGPGVGLAPPDVLAFAPLLPGDRRELTGIGWRLRLAETIVAVPACVAPVPRFSRRDLPTTADLLDVFDLLPHDLSDAAKVRARYRELVRVLHPDRHQGNAGHTSRFLEVQACFEAWEKRQKS